jgi:hypothetical protein
MDPVFCATKISKMIRITSPTTSAHHAAASRVTGERVVGVVATPAGPDAGWGGTAGREFMFFV